MLCISDIHGHADALAAVLATAERRGYEKILVAGDLCFPGPKPLETWRRLVQSQAMCVQGVGDRALATLDADKLRARSDHERERLSFCWRSVLFFWLYRNRRRLEPGDGACRLRQFS